MPAIAGTDSEPAILALLGLTVQLLLIQVKSTGLHAMRGPDHKKP